MFKTGYAWVVFDIKKISTCGNCVMKAQIMWREGREKYSCAHCTHPAWMLLQPCVFLCIPFHHINDLFTKGKQYLCSCSDRRYELTRRIHFLCFSNFPELLYLWDFQTRRIYIFYYQERASSEMAFCLPIIASSFILPFSAVELLIISLLRYLKPST